MKTLKVTLLGAALIASFCFGKSFSKVDTLIGEYPELNLAKKSLDAAKAHLNKADKDYDGHRKEALKYTDKAMEEVDKAVAWADKQK
ncbi:MAG TPA: hypothetical protein VNZ86_08225 [Bacteroidia bacterium]|jgi:hypothetical protein|nr:hypothetical protein [Bacteroidia bacterium]